MNANLTVVGKISGAYRNTVPNEPVMPNFPIMLRVMMSGCRLVPSPARDQVCKLQIAQVIVSLTFRTTTH